MRVRFRCFGRLIAISSIVWMAGCRGLTGSSTGTGSGQGTSSFQLSVTMTGSGTGTVTSAPTGINCPTTCSATFPASTQVTLTATAGTSYTFAGWSGSCTGTSACSVTLTAANSVTAAFGASKLSINHVVVFLQENRSFDHYFGALRDYWKQNGIADQSFDGLPQFNPTTGAAPLQGPAPALPGCDPIAPFPASDFCHPDPTNLVTSYHFQSVCQENPSPFWNESHRDWDLADPAGNNPATMNGFVVTAADDARQQSPNLMDTNGTRAMGYFNGDDLNYYYYMASKFGTSDTWFAPVMSRTQLNRMYLLAATSAGKVYPIAPPETQLTAPIIFQELQAKGVTWRIYVDPRNTTCESDPTSQCLWNYSYISQFTYGQAVQADPVLVQNIVQISQFTADAQNGTLPQVAMIEPPSNAGLDEHPSDYDTSSPTNLQSGANFAASLINSVMTGKNWPDSVVFFTYDEAGGFYDHVPPQPMPSPDGIKPKDLVPGDICDTTATAGGKICDFTYSGFRVPLIVISPYSKKNFVSHQIRDYTAILKFIEGRFGVAALTNRDAAQPDMDDFFDFVNKPWATPPTPPAQNMAGQCNLTPQTL